MMALGHDERFRQRRLESGPWTLMVIVLVLCTHRWQIVFCFFKLEPEEKTQLYTQITLVILQQDSFFGGRPDETLTSCNKLKVKNHVTCYI